VLSDADLAQVPPLDRARLAHAYLRSRRFVVAPLVVGERVIGVVSADNKPSRRPISRQSVEPFSVLCQNLATALEESRLYAEARAREQEATRLYARTRRSGTRRRPSSWSTHRRREPIWRCPSSVAKRPTASSSCTSSCRTTLPRGRSSSSRPSPTTPPSRFRTRASSRRHNVASARPRRSPTVSSC